MKTMNLQQQRRITFDKIIDYVADFYDVNIDKILSHRRKKELVKARQTIIYIAREKLKKSYPSIGRKLGSRDHTTILHAYKRTKWFLANNVNFRKDIDTILDLIEKDDEAKRRQILAIVKKERKCNARNLLKSLTDVPNQKITPGHLRRQKDIIKKYRDGYTLEEIGSEYKITRERIRQIVEKALFFNAVEITKQGFTIDLDEFLKEKKKEHLEAVKQRYGMSQEKVILPKKEIRWSRYYDYCRRCGTTAIKHHSHGYCIECYPKTEIFKDIQESSRLRNIEKRRKKEREYYQDYKKRPKIIEKNREKADLKHFGGNREKALRASNYCCSICGLSRYDNKLKYNKDLIVFHLNNKNNNDLKNLKVVCVRCFSPKLRYGKTVPSETSIF